MYHHELSWKICEIDKINMPYLNCEPAPILMFTSVQLIKLLILSKMHYQGTHLMNN